MFDRTDIMNKAWAGYRKMAREMRETTFNRRRFALELRLAWASAKRNVEQAERETVEATPCATVAHVADENTRAAQIRSEMTALSYRERMDWNKHRALAAELAQIAA